MARLELLSIKNCTRAYIFAIPSIIYAKTSISPKERVACVTKEVKITYLKKGSYSVCDRLKKTNLRYYIVNFHTVRHSNPIANFVNEIKAIAFITGVWIFFFFYGLWGIVWLNLVLRFWICNTSSLLTLFLVH